MREQEDRYFCRVCQDGPDMAEALKLAREYAASFAPEECVPDDEYRQRLHICSLCPSLQGGQICRVCGCFVLARAKKRTMCCPNPAGNRWL